MSSDSFFQMIAVVPLTSTPGTGALYPQLAPEESGLIRRSYALMDQLRAISNKRVHGRLQPEELDAIDKGLYVFLGLRAPDRFAAY